MRNLKFATLILLTVYCVGSVFAQNNSKKIENECKIYGKSDVNGGNININVVKTDLRDILNIITEQYGCKFVVDKLIGQLFLTVDVTDVPWNILLQVILKSQNLVIQPNEQILRVAKIETLEEEKKSYRLTICPLGEVSPLITEKINLKYIPNKTDAKAEAVLNIIHRQLTKRGSVTLNESSKLLTITDVCENLDAIKSLINLLDNNQENKEDGVNLGKKHKKLAPVPLFKSN